MTLPATYSAEHVYFSGGDIMIRRRAITRTEALALLNLWRDERTKAAIADDRPAWEAARALHHAMKTALLEADRWARASRPVDFGGALFSILGGVS